MTDEELGQLMQQSWNEYPNEWKFDTFKFGRLVAAPLEEEIKRLRFCIPEGDAAAAMEYLAHCVEKEIAKEQERCMEIVERELEAALGYVAVPLGNKITNAIRARGDQ
jgi:hypothetical protein